MKRAAQLLLALLLILGVVATPAAAGGRVIVRVSGGLTSLQLICRLLGCSIKYGLGDPASQVFLITTPDTVSPTTFLKSLTSQAGVSGAELDLLGRTLADDARVAAPLSDRTPVSYYSSTVWHGYVNQPASQIVGVV